MVTILEPAEITLARVRGRRWVVWSHQPSLHHACDRPVPTTDFRSEPMAAATAARYEDMAILSAHYSALGFPRPAEFQRGFELVQVRLSETVVHGLRPAMRNRAEIPLPGVRQADVPGSVLQSEPRHPIVRMVRKDGLRN